MPANRAYMAAGLFGAGLWVATAAFTGKREAWDSSLYWAAAYPAAFAAAAVLGFLVPRRPWRWALTLMVAQAVTMAVAAADVSLLPLGLILFAILSVPLCAGAFLGALLQRWRSQTSA